MTNHVKPSRVVVVAASGLLMFATVTCGRDGGTEPSGLTQVLTGTHDLLEGRHDYPRIELLTPDQAMLAKSRTTATTIGWGLTSERGNPSSVLKKLESQIIGNNECKIHLDSAVASATICAGLLGSSESPAVVTGGPLIDGTISRTPDAGGDRQLQHQHLLPAYGLRPGLRAGRPRAEQHLARAVWSAKGRRASHFNSQPGRKP